ncbi:MAG: hypothetical protein RL059_513 [Bacteroidota bacterium]|jgi:hypothetical protein
MKTILLIVSAIVFLMIDPQVEVPYAKIESAFNSQNASTIISYGKDYVLLNVLDKEGAYNHAQAEVILQDFFDKNPGGTFSYTFKGKESEESVFCMGQYALKNDKFKVSIQFEKIKSAYQFGSLTITLEKK